MSDRPGALVKPAPASRWRHYKGGVYTVVGGSTAADGPFEGDWLVLYRRDGDDALWSRSVTDWYADVGGQARFMLLN